LHPHFLTASPHLNSSSLDVNGIHDTASCPSFLRPCALGFNMRKVAKGKVSIKLWDLGGQPRFRSMWERYCRGVNAVVYVVGRFKRTRLDPSRKR